MSAWPAARTASAAAGVRMWLSAWTRAFRQTALRAAAYGSPSRCGKSDGGMILKKSKYEPVPHET